MILSLWNWDDEEFHTIFLMETKVRNTNKAEAGGDVLTLVGLSCAVAGGREEMGIGKMSLVLSA